MKLRVGSALPDPPFESLEGGVPTGFDIELTKALARELQCDWELVPYDGDDFEGIFAGLGERYDLVASGTTLTPKRQTLARFCTPYLRSGQSLVVNVHATPQATTIDALAGFTVGIQRGNTSQTVAQALLAQNKIGKIAWYAYHDITLALDDLQAARIGAVIKLEPVMRALAASRPELRVVQAGLTVEAIAYAVGLGNDALAKAVDAAQARLLAAGTIDALAQRWFTGNTHTEVSR